VLGLNRDVFDDNTFKASVSRTVLEDPVSGVEAYVEYDGGCPRGGAGVLRADVPGVNVLECVTTMQWLWCTCAVLAAEILLLLARLTCI